MEQVFICFQGVLHHLAYILLGLVVLSKPNLVFLHLWPPVVFTKCRTSHHHFVHMLTTAGAPRKSVKWTVTVKPLGGRSDGFFALVLIIASSKVRRHWYQWRTLLIMLVQSLYHLFPLERNTYKTKVSECCPAYRHLF